MTAGSTPVLQWRAPSARTGIGIAVMVLGASSLLVFGVIGLAFDHTPRTANVPWTGGGVSLLVFGLGLALIASVPKITVDFERRQLRRGVELLANLSRTQALLLRETLQHVPLQSGGSMEARSWGLHLVQVDPESAPWAAEQAVASPDDEDVIMIEVLRGVRRPRAVRLATRLADELDRPLLELDAAGELQAHRRRGM